VTVVSLRVAGEPAPQGSKRHVGKGILVESSRKVAPWREAVISEIYRAGWRDFQFPGCVEVSTTFLFKRPKAHYRTGQFSEMLKDDAPRYVGQKPDLDKLIRSTWDALTQSGIIRDDAMIVVSRANKLWCGTTELPGALITIGDMPQ
jgi:crossover junction endodeoxyribonuclease RusA